MYDELINALQFHVDPTCDNLLAYAERKAIELDYLSDLAFKDWRENGNYFAERRFYEYEAQKRTYLDILDQNNQTFYHYVENGKIKKWKRVVNLENRQE